MTGLIGVVLGLLGKLLDYFTRKDERDISHDQGEKQGVAETQAATAQHAVEESRQAAKNDEEVRAMTDAQLDAELRGDKK